MNKIKIGGKATKNGVEISSENFKVKSSYNNNKIEIELEKVKNLPLISFLGKIPLIGGTISILNKSWKIFVFFILLSFYFIIPINIFKYFNILVYLAFSLFGISLFVVNNISKIMNKLNKKIESGRLNKTNLLKIKKSIDEIQSINDGLYYHGAEHKVINCYYCDLDLVYNNIKKSDIFSHRCGTVFLTNIFMYYLTFNLFFPNLFFFFNLLLSVSLSTWTMEISDKSKFLSKHLNSFGLLVEKIMLREPEDKHIKIAETSIKTLLALESGKIIMNDDEEFLCLSDVEKIII